MIDEMFELLVNLRNQGIGEVLDVISAYIILQ